MIIRPADVSDFDACIALDPSFQTDHVWQMEEREEDNAILIAFRTARLPRTMRVTYPRERDSLAEDWDRGECVLVAEEEDGEILGFLSMMPQDWHDTGWIHHLVVDRHHRRHGVGSTLLSAAAQWARERGLVRLMTEAQTKNYPAICFYQKHGLTFCGFNDRFYASQDIALFFTLSLR
ncbi:MAG: GNAT family N-acetyltransferase [Chloroflexota bacterium]|nr:GNAT family N-acetyltransferase [Chloroflexota bacterium]